MRYYKYLVLCLTICVTFTAWSQENPPPPPSPVEPAATQGTNQWQDLPVRQPGISIEPDSVRFWPQSDLYLDLTFASFARTYAASFSANRLYHVLESRRLVLGYGARFNVYRGAREAYSAAPQYARLHSLSDSLYVERATFYSLNLALQLRYRIFPRFDIGVNTDVAGFSFGPQVTGQYVGASDPGFPDAPVARPTPYNVFLTGPRDRGTLNSEFFLVYHIRRNLDIRGGYNIFTTEYTTNSRLNHGNDRFRNRNGMVFVGISYLPFY